MTSKKCKCNGNCKCNSKGKCKNEIQGFFAPLRMTTSIWIARNGDKAEVRIASNQKGCGLVAASFFLLKAALLVRRG